MSVCCKGRVQKGQARYFLPPHAAPPAPGGTLATRTAYLLKQCLESLLRARMRRVDARALLAVFPHHWEDGVPVCLVYHTDSDGDFGAFRMVLQGDGQPALQCTACNAIVGGVGGAESHVFTGKPTNNAKKYLYVYSVQLSLAALTDRINDGLLQAHDLVWRAQHQPQIPLEALQLPLQPRGPPQQLLGGVSNLAAYGAANPAALAVLAGAGSGSGGGAGAVVKGEGVVGNGVAVQEDAAEALMLLGREAGRALMEDQDAMDAAAVDADEGGQLQEEGPVEEHQGRQQQQQQQQQQQRAARIPLQQLDGPQEQGRQQQQHVKDEPMTDAQQQRQQEEEEEAPAGATEAGATAAAGAADELMVAAEGAAQAPAAAGIKSAAEASAAAAASGGRGVATAVARHRSGPTVPREVGPGAGPRANASGGAVAPGVGGGFKVAPPEQKAAAGAVSAAGALGRSLGTAAGKQRPPSSAPLPGLPLITGAPGAAAAGVKRGHEATVSSSAATSSGSGSMMSAAQRFIIVNAEGKPVATAMSGPALAALQQQGRVPAVPAGPAAAGAAGAAEVAAEVPPAKKAKVQQQQQQQQQQRAVPGLPTFAAPAASSPSKQGHPQRGAVANDGGLLTPAEAKQHLLGNPGDMMEPEGRGSAAKPSAVMPAPARQATAATAAGSSRSTQLRFSTNSAQPPWGPASQDSSSMGVLPGTQQSQQQSQQQQGGEEISYHQLTVQAVNLADQPEGGLEAYTLVCDLLDGADPVGRQVGADLLRLLQAGDPQQLAQWDLAAMMQASEFGAEGSSYLEGLRDVLLTLHKLQADWEQQEGQQQQQQQQQRQQSVEEAAQLHAQQVDAASTFRAASQQLLVLFRQPRTLHDSVYRNVRYLLADSARFLQEVHSPVIPKLAQTSLLGGAAAAMRCAAADLLSSAGTGEEVSAHTTVGKLAALLKYLKQEQQEEVLGCSALWGQLAACLAEARDGLHAAVIVVDCHWLLCTFGMASSHLAPGMLAAHPGYAAGLLRVMVKQGYLVSLINASSTFAQQQGAPAQAPLDSLVVQEMQLCSSLVESLLGRKADLSDGQVQQLAAAHAQAAAGGTPAEQAAQQAAVACMFSRLQLVEAALDVVLQLPEADLLAHVREAAASGTPTAVGLAARVVAATAGEKRPEVVAMRVRMPRSNCERLLGARRQSEAVQ